VHPDEAHAVIGGDLKDGVGTVLLAEDTEEYELEILGPDDDVRRTVTGLTSPTFIYTAAMQAEDFPEGYPASAFVVYQIRSGGAGLCRPVRLPRRAAAHHTRREHRRRPGRRQHLELSRRYGHGPARYDGVSGQVLSASAYLGSSASTYRSACTPTMRASPAL
jgi:hypothetical protein